MNKKINITVNNQNKNFKLLILENETINDVKLKISINLETKPSKIRLYNIENGLIKTGFCYYGIRGDELFLKNYGEFDDFIIYLI